MTPPNTTRRTVDSGDDKTIWRHIGGPCYSLAESVDGIPREPQQLCIQQLLLSDTNRLRENISGTQLRLHFSPIRKSMLKARWSHSEKLRWTRSPTCRKKARLFSKYLCNFQWNFCGFFDFLLALHKIHWYYGDWFKRMVNNLLSDWTMSSCFAPSKFSDDAVGSLSSWLLIRGHYCPTKVPHKDASPSIDSLVKCSRHHQAITSYDWQVFIEELSLIIRLITVGAVEIPWRQPDCNQ